MTEKPNPEPRKSRSAKNMAAARKNIGVGAETVALLDRIWSKVRTFAKEWADTDLPVVQMVTGSGRVGMPNGSIRFGAFIYKENGDGLWTHKATGDVAPEFFVSGETLGRGAVEALTTILHESTHALCYVNRNRAVATRVATEAEMILAEANNDTATVNKCREVIAECEATEKAWKETTRQYRYHNKIFAEKATTFGLEYTHGRANEDVGYSAVTLSEMGRVLWGEELDELERLTPAYIELVFVPVTSDPADDRVRVAPTGGADDAPAEPPTPKQNRRTFRCSCNRSILAYPTDMAEAAVTCGRCGSDFE